MVEGSFTSPWPHGRYPSNVSCQPAPEDAVAPEKAAATTATASEDAQAIHSIAATASRRAVGATALATRASTSATAT